MIPLDDQMQFSLSKNTALMQLFVYGPTWDGNLISKDDRDELFKGGLSAKLDGWNYLTDLGVFIAAAIGITMRNADEAWYNKASHH